MRLVTGDAHRGLVEAIGRDVARPVLAALPHPLRGEPDVRDPKSQWGWVKALLHSLCDKPGADAVHAQFDRIVDALTDKLPAVAGHLDGARADVLVLPDSRKRSGGRSGRTTPGTAQPGIRRRTDVVDIFPDRNALVRLVGAALAEQHDEGPRSRYIDLDVLRQSRRTIIDSEPVHSEEVLPAAITA